MKFVSWNVNGLRACEGKGFSDIFRQLDADFFCLQETKMQAGQLDLQFEGYQSFWNYADKKGYSGTAVYTRHQPLNVTYGIGIDAHDHEGRVITLEMPDFFLVCCYTPNSQDGLKRLDYRMTWEDDFRAYLQRLDAQKPVILCGDLNVAHEEIDIKNPVLHLVEERVYRHLPLSVSRGGEILMVVLPLSGAPEECGVAHRLLCRLRSPAPATLRCPDPHRRLRLRPLSGSTYPEIRNPRLNQRGSFLFLK